ncbi:MAG TPA: ATP-dependent DNA helicase [Jiangellaceae bacterium]|nr:ATP-dependent DNA helicase [Jiangellaceae bacterium]
MTAIRLVRAPRDEVVAPLLDDAQRRVVEHRGGPLLVLAGPGAGKTTTLVESVVDRVERDKLDPEQVLVLTFSRRAAAELRERIAARLHRTVREPLARTFHSYAFGLLRREAVLRGEPQPRLLTGAEQDLLIRDLIRGELEELGADYWPERVRAALPTRGFAEELRDLLMRAAERGITPGRLAALGRERGRDDWVAASRFARQYAGVTALRHPPAYDPAELVRAAADLLRSDDELLARERAARAFVVVDEYQDSDPAQEDLLDLLAGGGRELVVVGDPDQSIYGFRGAEIEGIRNFPDRFRTADGSPAAVLALEVSRRCGPTLLAASRRVAARLGGPPQHRRLSAADPAAVGVASVHVLHSPSQEAAYIASRLREQHLVHGVPWTEMAVLVRSAQALPVLRRGLAAAGVPVSVRLEEVPLVDQPPARALLDVLEIASGRRELDADLAYSLITGPLAGADPLALRRLRQELRGHELQAGGGRASGELLVEAISEPAGLAELSHHAVAPAVRLASVLAAAGDAAAKPGATAEDVLWAAWSSARLAGLWTRTALAGGSAGAAADRDLDAVVALFDAVARYVDRLPGEGPAGFLEHVRGQQIPSDTLTVGAPPGPAVQLMTAHAAKGLEWEIVAVAGVQEGVWPDLRVRGGLLGTDSLVDVVAGRDDSPVARQSARLAEERRLFYVAVTRARTILVVTAVSGEDAQPSRFLDDLDPLPAGFVDERPVERVPRGMNLPSVVAELRRIACDAMQDEARRRGAARQIARLAAAGVPSAAPEHWYGLPELSDTAPLRHPGEAVRISPSKLEEFQRCQLRWLLKSSGATDTDTIRAGIGTLVHDLAEVASRERWSESELLAELDRRWQRMDVGSGWVERREYERVRGMVERLGRWLSTRHDRFIAAESPFDVEIGRARLAGRVDRLERDDRGRPVVVDYKTGKSKVRDDDVPVHPQLGVYQLAAEYGAFDEYTGGVRESGGAMLVQLQAHNRGQAREQVQPPLGDAEDSKWAEKLVAETADGMAGWEFLAQPSTWCGYCPARMSCPAHAEGGQVTP